MTWTETLTEVIDTRSFSNLWFWIVVAVTWSSASYFVMGVPFDLIQRAKRQGGQAMQDLQDAARISCNRFLHMADTAGLWLVGFVTFFHSAMLVIAFWYWVEFAQAIELIALPMTLVFELTLRLAREVRERGLEGPELVRKLMRHRFWTQLIGMVALFVTAMFGMYQNLTMSPIPGW
ncbi:component of SufBCD complex [Wenxinia saemankumensis]|uniref:Component of SufBCD complex n=1 Tax=Wenxinia saemankumensis TaxID=1447782 RepID=A0A1M6A4B5_9RHOB|nr:component of SufBCD complex [Wenxinia saemankumensis]SHI31296.1 hypothetical protein SAMN05444417_0214 [Wenxinia saemankumensis]